MWLPPKPGWRTKGRRVIAGHFAREWKSLAPRLARAWARRIAAPAGAARRTSTHVGFGGPGLSEHTQLPGTHASAGISQRDCRWPPARWCHRQTPSLVVAKAFHLHNPSSDSDAALPDRRPPRSFPSARAQHADGRSTPLAGCSARGHTPPAAGRDIDVARALLFQCHSGGR